MLQRDIFGNVAAFCYEFDMKVAVVWLAFIIMSYLSPLKSFAHSFYYIYLFCECAVLSWHECGSQRTTRRSEFSLSTRWAPGLELKSSGLVASALTHQAISPAPPAEFSKENLRHLSPPLLCSALPPGLPSKKQAGY